MRKRQEQTWKHKIQINSVRRIAGIITAKVIRILCRLTGSQGETLAGKIAIRIAPDLLEYFSLQIKKDIFVVCGTNGKTTTNQLLCRVLEREGYCVVCNSTGSNMLQGVVTAFLRCSRWNGKLEADYACIEVDEASAPRVFSLLKPGYMILTNIFRDQLDRYGEVDLAMNLLQRAINEVPDLKVAVNGDDPLAYYLAKTSGKHYVTFGISVEADHRKETNKDVNNESLTLNTVYDKNTMSEIRDGGFCKVCGSRLIYEYYHFGHLGKYKCTNCDFERKLPDYSAEQIQSGSGISFWIQNNVEKCNKMKKDNRTIINTKEADAVKITLQRNGLYNVYNVLGVYAASQLANCGVVHFSEVTESYKSENGRLEQFQIGDVKVILNLAKNPAGFNQNIEIVCNDKGPKDLVIAINDNEADGIDISWLWDVEFERLKVAGAGTITVCGKRYLDMKVRMKYSDITVKGAESIKEALKDSINNSMNGIPISDLTQNKLNSGQFKKVYVLVNYTALTTARKTLTSMSGCSKCSRLRSKKYSKMPGLTK